MDRVTWSLEEDGVALVTMRDGENRLNASFLESFQNALDAVERETDARAVVVTSDHEKIFSNGIDLDWLMPLIQAEAWEEAKAFFSGMMALFRRILIFPAITVAAISGHSFAGGAIMSCAFDFRFMRSDRGFFCFPEVDLGIPFLPGMIAVISKAVPAYAFEEMQYTGRRLTAEECASRHIVTKACPRETLLKESMAFAASLKKRREVVGEMKRRMYRDILRIIDDEDPPVIESGVFYV
jgi:Delta3-Delta2-enoyl-CoA isomerase